LAPISRFSCTVKLGNKRLPSGTRATDRLALQAYGILIDLDQTRERFQEGAFARAVGPDDGHHLTTAEFKVNAKQGLRIAIKGLQRMRREDGAHASIPM
jgi:hypothetical protein